MSDDRPRSTPHGPLRGLLPDVWWLQGSVSMAPGVRISRVMVVLRHQGSLTLVNMQHWPNLMPCSLLAKAACAAAGFTRSPAVIGPPWRKASTPPEGSLEPDFRRLLALPFAHLVGGHGEPLLRDAKSELAATVDATWP